MAQNKPSPKKEKREIIIDYAGVPEPIKKKIKTFVKNQMMMEVLDSDYKEIKKRIDTRKKTIEIFIEKEELESNKAILIEELNFLNLEYDKKAKEYKEKKKPLQTGIKNIYEYFFLDEYKRNGFYEAYASVVLSGYLNINQDLFDAFISFFEENGCKIKGVKALSHSDYRLNKFLWEIVRTKIGYTSYVLSDKEKHKNPSMNWIQFRPAKKNEFCFSILKYLYWELVKNDYIEKVKLGANFRLMNTSVEAYKNSVSFDAWIKKDELKATGKKNIKIEEITEKYDKILKKAELRSNKDIIAERANRYKTNNSTSTLQDHNNSDVVDLKVYPIKPKDFLTRTRLNYCSSGEHKLEDIVGNVKVLNSVGEIENISFPAAYCDTCKKYYVLESEYRKLKLRGRIICKIVEHTYWNDPKNRNGFNLNKESLLHIMGYNVNAQEDLSQMQRQKILEIIIKEGILTKAEVCSHLDYLINRSIGRVYLMEASNKWKADRDYITSYDKNSKSVEVNSIVYNKYNKKKY